MLRRRGFRLWSSWIAMLAILMTALAPTVSHALARSDHADAGWVEICRGAGSTWIYIGSADVTQAGHPPSDTYGHALDHCPYCTLHAAHPGSPPAPMAIDLLVLGHATPQLPASVLQARLAWYRALSRGPPVSI
jgi:hypothetical protein